MKKTTQILFLFSFILLLSCGKLFNKEYQMSYYRDSSLRQEKILAKDDIDAYDKAYLSLTAMKRVENMLAEEGVNSPLGEAPDDFILTRNGKVIIIPIEKKEELKEKWLKLAK